MPTMLDIPMNLAFMTSMLRSVLLPVEDSVEDIAKEAMAISRCIDKCVDNELRVLEMSIATARHVFGFVRHMQPEVLLEVEKELETLKRRRKELLIQSSVGLMDRNILELPDSEYAELLSKYRRTVLGV